MDQAEREAARRVRKAQAAEREAAQRNDEAMARDAARRARSKHAMGAGMGLPNLGPNAPVTSNERASKDRFGLWTRKRNFAARKLQLAVRKKHGFDTLGLGLGLG